jgi:uncharacterized RDD family membrane protein YckC
MNKEPHSFSSKNTPPIQVDLDEFQISEDTFKPMTKGLGFHQDTKRPSFTPAPKETKSFGSAKSPMNPTLNSLPTSMAQTKTAVNNQMPSGLEAFYGTKPEPQNLFEKNIEKAAREEIKKENAVAAPMVKASMISQFFAWIIDVLVIASFVILTGALLVFASGININMYSRLISTQDAIVFGAAIFSIYYLLYFTILDLSASPGKTIFAIRLVKADGGEVSVKHTFGRALISLLSGVALFLPMLLDFQGRLSDTKVVK